MPKRYRGRRYSKKYKWSIERTSFRSLLTPIQAKQTQKIPIVPAINQEGTRCVKNFTLDIALTYGGGLIDLPDDKDYQLLIENLSANVQYYWAIVYVPEGYEPQDLLVPDFTTETPQSRTLDLYLASQFIIACGSTTAQSGHLRIKTRMARNLNSGDAVALLIRPTLIYQSQLLETGNFHVNALGLAQYAICFK